jgi:hypothetical protein
VALSSQPFVTAVGLCGDGNMVEESGIDEPSGVTVTEVTTPCSR